MTREKSNLKSKLWHKTFYILLFGIMFITGKYIAKYFLGKPLIWDDEVFGILFVVVVLLVVENSRILKKHKSNENT